MNPNEFPAFRDSLVPSPGIIPNYAPMGAEYCPCHSDHRRICRNRNLDPRLSTQDAHKQNRPVSTIIALKNRLCACQRTIVQSHYLALAEERRLTYHQPVVADSRKQLVDHDPGRGRKTGTKTHQLCDTTRGADRGKDGRFQIQPNK